MKRWGFDMIYEGAAMWLLLAGPIALRAGIPGRGDGVREARL